MSNQTITYLAAAGAAAISIIAFCTLVLVPALTSYRRPLQRVGAALLSLYVLGAFVGAGVVLGLLVIVEWPRLF